MENPEELTGAERAALIGWWFARGEQMTTRQVAEKLSMNYPAAYMMLSRLCRVLPITFEQPSPGLEGYWYAIST